MERIKRIKDVLDRADSLGYMIEDTKVLKEELNELKIDLNVVRENLRPEI